MRGDVLGVSSRLTAGLAALAVVSALAAAAAPSPLTQSARDYFGADARVGKFSGQPLSAPVFRGDKLSGYLARTADMVRIPAYSGEPINVLIALDTGGSIVGIKIIEHSEPILLAGVSEADMLGYVAQYRGMSAYDRVKIGGELRAGYVTVDGLAGATITAMVLNATITRAARLVAASRGLPLAVDPGGVAKLTAPGQAADDPGLHSAGAMWVDVWQQRRFRIAVLALGLFTLSAILVFQDWLTRHPTLLGYLRTGFLVYTLFFIGWYGLAQLSVINVLTFANALFSGFDWATFLIDPMMFILWAFVACTILLWGRGVYCGWLCPFGALQELVNKAALWLGLHQWRIPAVVHERLLAVKYLLLVALFGLSLQSMADAIRYAEVEPFKTAINMRFQREWTFVLYACLLVLVSAFNGKFFCKYLCPLGAALTIPSHFRIFDWLRRRRECGRPCQTCARECPSDAIRPTGEINAAECHYCLDCQVIYWNELKCPPLVEKRKRRERRRAT
jgi:polyferredoxin